MTAAAADNLNAAAAAAAAGCRQYHRDAVPMEQRRCAQRPARPSARSGPAHRVLPAGALRQGWWLARAGAAGGQAWGKGGAGWRGDQGGRWRAAPDSERWRRRHPGGGEGGGGSRRRRRW
jgi:hypothetical protein